MMPSKLPTPSLVMMPTGLHIAGSYKNLKSSGIANFLRGKRNKKQMQFSIPLPMLQMGMPMSMYGAAPHQHQHQRVAIEQLYPFKPRSPRTSICWLCNSRPASLVPRRTRSRRSRSCRVTTTCCWSMAVNSTLWRIPSYRAFHPF